MNIRVEKFVYSPLFRVCACLCFLCAKIFEDLCKRLSAAPNSVTCSATANAWSNQLNRTVYCFWELAEPLTQFLPI